MKRISWLITIESLLIFIAGCTLETPLQGVPCPQELETGKTLNYISINGTKCTRDMCVSQKNCCGLIGETAKLAYQSFYFNRCAEGTAFSFCYTDSNQLNYYCGPSGSSILCDPGTHPNLSNTSCENDTVDDCGGIGISCRQQGALTVYCVLDDGAAQSKCVSSACDNHYHLKDGVCVADSATECGSGFEDCSQNTSTGMTICSNGRCDSRCSGNEHNCQGNCLFFTNIHIDNCDNNVLKCQDGYIDLDGDVTNGCEINKAMVHIESYDAVNKKIECVSGYANWDNDLVNGCETDLSIINVKDYDVMNDLITCIDNYADCDGRHYPVDAVIDGVVQKSANGCEINLMEDNTHCGQCATIDEVDGQPISICSPEHVCQDGICVRNNCLGQSAEIGTPNMCLVFIPELDEEGQPVYDGDSNPAGSYENQCFNIHSNDPDRCGACDHKCSANPATHATSNTCENGVCQYVCESGYTNCSDSSTDIGINCISDAAMQQDSNNCGGCGIICGVNDNGEKTVCVGGVCVVNSCVNEHEVPCLEDSGMVCHDLNSTDASNCGACGYICANNPTSTATSNECKAGACQYTCNVGYTQCSENDEMDKIICIKTSDMLTDPNNCGGCGISCNSHESCVDGVCMRNSCSDGLTLCGLDDCRSTKFDPNNCGACNYICSEHLIIGAESNSCSAGKCQYSCKHGYTKCSTGTTADTIVCVKASDMLTDPKNCGGCGILCPSGQTCINGVCGSNICSGGKLLCGPDDCRIVNGEDPANCGACDYVCEDHPTLNATSSTCSGGVCQYVCQSSTDTNCGGKTLDTVNCVNLKNDNNHCGSCSNSCDTSKGKYCNNGTCKQSCPDGMSKCDSGCRDLNYDSYNCGTCNHSCGKGERCSLGVCLPEFGGGIFYGNDAINELCQSGNEMCASLGDDIQHCGTYAKKWYDFETGLSVEASNLHHDIYYNEGVLQPSNGKKFFLTNSIDTTNVVANLYTNPYCPNEENISYSESSIVTGQCSGTTNVYCFRTSDGNYYKMFAITNEMPTLLIWHLAIPTDERIY